MFTLDQATQFKKTDGKRYGRFVLTLFNSTAQWQNITLDEITPENAAGSPTGDTFGGSPGVEGGPRRIAPGGTVPVELGWLEVSASTTKFAYSTTVEPIGAPAASGLSIERDPRVATLRDKKKGFTRYWVLVHNTSSKRRTFAAFAKHYSTIGNLTDLGDAEDSVGAGKTASIMVQVYTTTKIPNLLRFSVETN